MLLVEVAKYACGKLVEQKGVGYRGWKICKWEITCRKGVCSKGCNDDVSGKLDVQRVLVTTTAKYVCLKFLIQRMLVATGGKYYVGN